MIFLNPAVLLGLIAASIPVLIHLLNLKKLKRIDFSTLTFLKELQKNKIRKIKIKQLLLLALRVMIILFLVMTFARPTLQGISIGGVTSAAKTTAVFILDNTFSMSVVDNNGSYLNQAKQTIKELTNQLQEGDEAALILTSNLSGEKINNDDLKPTSDLANFIKQVDAADISCNSSYLNNAVVKAAKILSQSQNFNKEIYILSDFQKGKIYEQSSLSDLGEILNDKVKIYSFNYSGKEVFNIGIDNLKVNTQIFEKDKPVDFCVTITNYSDKPAKNNVVSLFLNNERSAQQSVNLEPGETKILTMESIVKSTGYINVFAEIEDDDIMQDNKRFTSLYIPDEISVGIFTGENQDVKYINLALTASDEDKSLKVNLKNIDQISSFDLNQFDVVMIIGLDKLSDFQRIKSYLNNGGGLFLMPGSRTSLEDFKKIDSVLSLPKPDGTVGKISSAENSVGFENISFNHPVFQNIFSKEKNRIESPDIYYHFKISTGGKGTNIISLVDGSSFLSEYKLGKGKIFLMNIAPVLSWSNFPLKGIFVPLINKSVFYLASKDKIENEHLTGSSINIDISDQNLPQIKIERPDKSEEFIDMKGQSNQEFISYNKANLAGNYQVFSGNKVINDFAVNVDATESVIEYISDDEFKDYLNKIDFKGNYIKVDKNDDPAKIVLQSRFGSELWKYFLLIALILALIEMMVARNSKKEMVNLE
jgi:Aerotolerance regulator N-terminal/von Willebrand factor type A domain